MFGTRHLFAGLFAATLVVGVVQAHDPHIATVTPPGDVSKVPARSVPELPTPIVPSEDVAAPAATEPMPAPAVAGRPGKSDFETGLALFREESYQGASAAFARFISANAGHPLVPNARHWLGRSELEMGHYQDAIEALRSAYHGEARTSWAPRNLLHLADAYDRMGRSGEACGALRLAARHSMGTASQRFRAGSELQRLSCL